MTTTYHLFVAERFRRLLHSVLFGFLSAAVACGDQGTAPEPTAVARVVVEPAQVSLVVGETRTLVAVAQDAAGRVLHGRTVTWSASDASLASVSDAGTVTAVALGTARITATIESKTAESQVTVMPGAVDRIELSLTTLAMLAGEERQLTAVVKDAGGRVLQRLVTWSSSDATVVSVDNSGRVTAIRIGRADVTATVQGHSATAVVTVNPRPVATIDISPPALVLDVGESRQMQALLKDALGNVLQGRSVQWSVDNGSATITPTGLLQAVRSGYISITASSEGVSSAVGGTIIDAEYDFDLVYYRLGTAGSSELFVLPLGGGLAPVRVNAGNVSRTPSASPDGSRIAFAVSMVAPLGERVDDIFAVDRNGLNMKRLTSSPEVDDQPAWSPQGGRIAYHHWTINGRSDIWIMNDDGSAQLNLTSDMAASGYRSAPAWSRDGLRIAFTQTENGPNGTTASIWTMNADGSNKRQVTSTLTGFDAVPSWSPDGSRIAFMRYFAGEADIAIVDVSTRIVTRIAMPGMQSSPAWSPDGTLIAFTQDDHPLTNIYTMQPNGTRVRLRTVDAAWGGGLAPAWISKPLQ